MAGKEDSLDDVSSGVGLLKLKARDGEAVQVERKFAFISNLIKTSLEGDPDTSELPIPGVDGKTLKLVVQYMNQHKGLDPEVVEKPLKSTKMVEVVKDPWDATFIDDLSNDRKALYDIVLAANYLDIKSLLHLGCAKIASLIKGQPLEKVRDILAPKSEPNKA